MSYRASLVVMAAAIAVASAAPASALPITFNSRIAFNGAAPGLPIETFEAGLVSPGGLTACNGPLSGATASSCFPIGGLLPGVIYNASGSVQPNMVILSAGFAGGGMTSKTLGPNAFADTFNITFAGSPNAIGFDVFAGVTAGNVVISAFSPTNASLGTFTIAAPLAGAFFGIISDVGPIGRLNVASQASPAGELVDNLAFGTVPEPSSFVLVGLGAAGLAARRRATRRASKRTRGQPTHADRR